MENRRRRYTIPIILLVAVLGLGVVYAATTGLLNFSGTAVINPNAVVTFQDFYIGTGDVEDGASASNNDQTLNFTVHLDEYGDYAEVVFKVYNAGNVPVNIGGFTNTTTPPTGITVTYPSDLVGERLSAGESSGYYSIQVEWTGPADMTPDSYSFSATLSYAQTT